MSYCQREHHHHHNPISVLKPSVTSQSHHELIQSVSQMLTADLQSHWQLLQLSQAPTLPLVTLLSQGDAHSSSLTSWSFISHVRNKYNMFDCC